MKILNIKIIQKKSEKLKDNIFNEIYEDIQKYFIKSKDDLILFKNKIIIHPTEENKSSDLFNFCSR